MAIKKSMARSFLLLTYHVLPAIPPPITVTFSTPTAVNDNHSVGREAADCRSGGAVQVVQPFLDLNPATFTGTTMLAFWAVEP
jgi:hypothetical protein